MIKNYMYTGSFLVAEWLGFQAFTAGAWVQSLVGELRCLKPGGTPTPPHQKKKNYMYR